MENVRGNIMQLTRQIISLPTLMLLIAMSQSCQFNLVQTALLGNLIRLSVLCSLIFSSFHFVY